MFYLNIIAKATQPPRLCSVIHAEAFVKYVRTMAQFINLFTWGYRCLAVQAPSIEKTTYSPPPFHLQLSFFVENFLTMFILVYFWASCCVLLIYLFFLWPASQSSLFQLIQQVWSKGLLVTLLLLFLSIFLLCCIFPLFTQTWVTLSIPTKKICYNLDWYWTTD